MSARGTLCLSVFLLCGCGAETPQLAQSSPTSNLIAATCIDATPLTCSTGDCTGQFDTAQNQLKKAIGCPAPDPRTAFFSYSASCGAYRMVRNHNGFYGSVSYFGAKGDLIGYETQTDVVAPPGTCNTQGRGIIPACSPWVRFPDC